MTKAEAALLLNVAPSANPEELRRRFQDAYSDFQVRLANAPTATLRKTYQKNLEELRIAFQTLIPELLDPTTDLPSSQPLPAVKEQRTKPTVVVRNSAEKTARPDLIWIVIGIAVSFAVLSIFLAIKLFSSFTTSPRKDSIRAQPPTSQTDAAVLLVMTDLECDWSVDGAPQLRLAKGGTIRVPVGLGKHIVLAATVDGADKIQTVIETARPQQEILTLDFGRVRAQRLDQQSKAEQEAEHRRLEAEAQLERQRRAAEAETRRRKHEEDAKLASLVQLWTDSKTGLLWQYRGDGAVMSYVDAFSYCQASRAGGLSKWRLPETRELRALYDTTRATGVKTQIKLNVCCWWSEQFGSLTKAFEVDFRTPSGGSLVDDHAEGIGTLCVHGEPQK